MNRMHFPENSPNMYNSKNNDGIAKGGAYLPKEPMQPLLLDESSNGFF